VSQSNTLLDEIIWQVTTPFAAALLTSAFLLFVGSLGTTTGTRVRQPVADAMLVYAALLVASLVFTSQPDLASQARLDPGADLRTALRAAPGDVYPWVQLVGNLVLLLPLGALAPMRISWLNNYPRVFLAGLAVAASIEIIQYLLITGRVMSTDDVVLNAVGAVLGSTLARPRRALRHQWYEGPRGPYARSVRQGSPDRAVDSLRAASRPCTWSNSTARRMSTPIAIRR
jgi:hypothetical protein